MLDLPWDGDDSSIEECVRVWKKNWAGEEREKGEGLVEYRAKLRAKARSTCELHAKLNKWPFVERGLLEVGRPNLPKPREKENVII